MGKLTVIIAAAAAMLFAGILFGKSEAMLTVGDMAKNHSVVEKAACGGWGRHCRPGRHWVCGRRHCWCALC